MHVPETDRRAGKAALVVDEPFDLDTLRKHLASALPTYAYPLFPRLRLAMEVTGTFKHRKVDLVREGFDPSLVADPLFVLDPETDRYQPLDGTWFTRICGGEIRF